MPDIPTNRPDGTEFDADSSPTRGTQAFNLGLILFILFRHKWKIVALGLLGLAIGLGFRKTVVVPYTSNAQVLIRYIEEAGTVTLDDDTKVLRPDMRGDTIIKTEMAILSSYDLARDVARKIGPERILGGTSGDPGELETAANVIYSGISVAPTGLRSQVLNVTYAHTDPLITQPVVQELVTSYLRRHAEIHGKSNALDQSLTQETDMIRDRLLRTEEELRKTLDSAGVLTMDGAKQVYADRIARTQESILQTEAELAERRAELAAITGSSVEPSEPSLESTTPEALAPLPEDKVNLYRQVLTRLQALRTRENELLTQFTAESRTVKGVRTQIEENENLKTRLEQEFPALATQGITPVVANTTTTAAVPGGLDPLSVRTRISSLESRMRVLKDQLARVRAESQTLTSLETTISELQRKKDMLEQQFRLFTEKAEQNRLNEALGPGRVSNISIVQSPAPPSRDMKKANLIALGLAGGGWILGIALAFAIELFLDQTVKRPAEVESMLGLPLALAIPHARSIQDARVTTPKASLPAPGATSTPQSSDTGTALVPWTASSDLSEYFDALRNRLIYNFEMRGITRKPKLVGVTSCGPDSGVSTVAANLAASLSETGDGNVLLVDMNPDRKTPQHFSRGSLKLKLDDVLDHESRDDALVQENLYMISPATADDKLSWVMPKRFASLVPKMKASDFDYIIFDMPPVSQISATPQIARYMDQVLMVVESEKTTRDSVKRAGTMLTEAGATVGVVLNKTRTHVPKMLDSDALAS